MGSDAVEGGRRRSRLPWFSQVSATALGALALSCGVASASQTHVLEETFGSAAQPNFSTPRGVAINQSTGMVLVMDTGTGTISRFHADGTPAAFAALGTNAIDGQGGADQTPEEGLSFGGDASKSQIAVDNSSGAGEGNIYVTQSPRKLIYVFSVEGEYLGQLSAYEEGPAAEGPGTLAFTDACGVAVDGAGAVYVGDRASGIHKYVPTTSPPVNADNTANFHSEEAPNPCNLAAGEGPTAGFLFAKISGGIAKLDGAGGALKYTLLSGAQRSVAVDPATGHVYGTTNSQGKVEEVDASGTGGATAVSAFNAGSAVFGLAVKGGGGDVFLSRLNNPQLEVYGPLVTVPDAVTGAASEVEGTSATLNGTVDPDGVAVTDCYFEYGTSTAYGQVAPCEPSAEEIGAGKGPVPVHADLAGLELGAEYHFRLVAGNANVSGALPGAPWTGEDSAFKLKSPPVILAQWTAEAIVGEAELEAEINPEGFATTYHVEYGTSEAYGQSTPESGSIGSDKTAHAVAVSLAGLAAGTTYHWRVVASNAIGVREGADRIFRTYTPLAGEADSCPNALFRNGGAALLPDCRAFELVSPIAKEGFDIKVGTTGLGNPIARNQTSTSGNKLTYSAQGRFGDALSTPAAPQYIASRGNEGWSSHGISPPRGKLDQFAYDNEFKAFSDDLCSAWLVNDVTDATPLTVEAHGGTFNLYRRSNCGADGYEWLGAGERDIKPMELQGTSADGSAAVFRTESHLAQDAATAPGQRLECRTPTEADTITYGWLRDGEEIAGASMSTYVTGAAEEGKTVQCRVSASEVSGGGSTEVANPAWVIAPYPASAPPEAPETIPAPSVSAPLTVGGPGGQTLDCDEQAAQWSGSPTEFSYRWYRNGMQIAGASGSSHEVSGGELATPASFQCEAIAKGIGGTVAKTSQNAVTDPAPETPVAEARGNDRFAMAYLRREGRTYSLCVLPGGTLNNGCTAGTLVGGIGDPGYIGSLGNAVSSDGGQVFWSPTGNFGGTSKLYLRENANQPQSAATVEVSAANVTFLGAASDGSVAIYRTGNLSGTGELYEYDVADEEARQIAGGVAGILGMSEDAGRVYLVSSEACGAGAEPGKPNLFLYETGEECAKGQLRFIATLAAGDANANPSNRFTPVSALAVAHAARVSPDGGVAAFLSTAPLAGYDNTDQASGEADTEVYRYEAASDRLDCVSCNPSWARPKGELFDSRAYGEFWVAGLLAGGQSQLYASRTLSDDGTRVFFDSFDPLLLRDTNGARDAYEWEAPGAGDCTTSSPAYSPLNGGCLSLLSSGKSPKDSEFVEASPSGNDVFFRTAESLVGKDPGLFDIYDARVGGGFAEPAAPEPCEGDACQSPAPAPEPPDPASSAFHGPGDLRSARSCGRSARRAVALARRARRARRAARRAERHRKKRRLRQKAASNAKRAKRLSRKAKRCRRANRS